MCHAKTDQGFFKFLVSEYVYKRQTFLCITKHCMLIIQLIMIDKIMMMQN